MKYANLPEITDPKYTDPDPPVVGEVITTEAGRQVKIAAVKLTSGKTLVEMILRKDDLEEGDRVVLRDHSHTPFLQWVILWEPLTKENSGEEESK